MAKKKSAAVSELEALHAAVARYMINRLESADQVIESDDEDEEDESFVIPLSQGEVANIINFLKHNNITAAPDDELLKELNSAFKGNEEFNQMRADRAASIVKGSKDGDDTAWLLT